MSSDNYIAILKCSDGYRVAHCQALENLYYWPTGRILNGCIEYVYNPETGEDEERPMLEMEERPEINPEPLKYYFEDSKVYNEKDAGIQAEKLLKEYEYVEYGIITIFYNREFPK